MIKTLMLYDAVLNLGTTKISWQSSSYFISATVEQPVDLKSSIGVGFSKHLVLRRRAIDFHKHLVFQEEAINMYHTFDGFTMPSMIQLMDLRNRF